MPKIVWRKNFEIFRMPIFTTGLAVFGAFKDCQKVVPNKILQDFLMVSEGYNVIAYVPKKQLRDLIEAVVEEIRLKPDKISQIHKDGLKQNSLFFQFIKKSLKINLQGLSDKQLVKLLEEYYVYHRKSNGRLTITTWFVDSDGEDLTKFLTDIVENRIKSSKSKINKVEAFSILSTPDKLSLATKEEIESLQILKIINSNLAAKKLFANNDIKYIEDNLDTIDSNIKRKIISHYKKWLWLPYTYIGPAYDLDYFITMWSGLIKQKIDIERNLINLTTQIERSKIERQKLIKELNFSNAEKKYFKIAREIIFLKAYRKDAWFFSSYLLEFVHREVAKRLQISLQQVRMMTFEEIPKALLSRDVSEKILNKRFKKSAYVLHGLKGRIFAAQDADKFLRTQLIEKENLTEIKILTGTAAMAGRAKGIVKIINVPEEMHKMNQGDIMVATTTYPSLVPAMKKAAAIVTNDGGITCHAAIVARELKKPCVVGTKIATKILKDGDMVLVDTTKGIVEKLK